MHRSLRSRRAAFGAATAVVALCAGGAVALATSSSTSSEIAACVKHGKGALYKVTVDPSAPLQCRAGDTSITWNQSGPAGPPGLGSLQRVVSGPNTIPTGNIGAVDMVCPDPTQQLVSGGYSVDPAAIVNVFTTVDGPVDDSTWRVAVANTSGSTIQLTTYVMCAGPAASASARAATHRVTLTPIG